MTLLSLDLRARSGFVFGLVSAALSAPCAFAGVNAWTPVGPEGGELCAIVAAPSNPATLWAAASFGGVFRSDDGGDHWTPAAGENLREACPLAVDGADSQRLYTVESSAGFLRSLDGGASWNPSNSGLPAPAINLFAVVTTAADASFLLATNGVEIYRSRDRGDSWQASANSATFQDASVQFLLALPSAAGTAYASSYAGGIFRSDDFGLHWMPKSVGLPVLPQAGALAVDPTAPARLYLATDTGIYRSLDGGDLWTPALATDYLGHPQRLVVRADGAVFGYDLSGYLLTSSDHGDTWQRLPAPLPQLFSYNTTDFAVTPGAIFSASFFGLERSLDGGFSWQEAFSGIQATSVEGLVQIRSHPDEIAALLSAGRSSLPQWLRSTTRGTNWTTRAISTPSGAPIGVRALSLDPSRSGRWLGQAFFPPESSLGPTPILTANDGGSWNLLAVPPCTAADDFRFDAVDESRIYVNGSPFGSPCIHQPDACFVWTSPNLGQSWDCVRPPVGESSLGVLRPNPRLAGILLAGGSAGIYLSADAGAQWTRVFDTPFAAGSPAPFFDFFWADGSHAYATSSAGLYATEDGGNHWSRRSATGESGILYSLALDPVHSEVVFAASQSGVVRSGDGGAHWSPFSTGLPPRQILGLLLDPVTPNRLLVSLAGGGVWSYEIREPSVCVPSDTSVCLRDGRFRLEAIWHDFFGNSGVGHGEALSNESSSFWFFDPANLELFVKELDGLGVNHSFWTFFGALSNVEYTLLATDTATGAMHGYFNPAGAFASVGDVDSFPQEDSASAGALALDSTSRPIERQRAATTPLVACAADDTTLCLQQNRFAVSVTWRDFQDHTGVGHTLPLTADTGSFWFFDAANTELVLKVLDGTGTNDAFWVFYGSLSNVTFDITVTDTVRGDQVTYHNPAGQFASVGDIGAFPQEPH